MAKESCTIQDFHRALRARDPLGIGFDSSTDLLLHLIWQLLAFDPGERMTAEEALQHAYFISPDGTLDSLNRMPGSHNALESSPLRAGSHACTGSTSSTSTGATCCTASNNEEAHEEANEITGEGRPQEEDSEKPSALNGGDAGGGRY